MLVQTLHLALPRFLSKVASLLPCEQATPGPVTQPTYQERLNAFEHRRLLVLEEVAALRVRNHSPVDSSVMSGDAKPFMSQEVIQYRLDRIEHTMAEMAKDVRTLRELSLAHQQLPAEAEELRRRVEVLEKLVVKAEGANWVVKVIWGMIGTAVVAGLIKWWSLTGGPSNH